MSTSTVQFITQMKLRELLRQRVQLRDAYQRLSQAAGMATEVAARVRLLDAGLRAISCAGQPLHPDVVNLEILLHEADLGAASEGVLELWNRRLSAEIATGQLRSEFVYLFGALLEEWARPDSNSELATQAVGEFEQLRAFARTPPPTLPSTEFLEAQLPQIAESSGEHPLNRVIEVHELYAALKALASDIYQPPKIRREAQKFVADGVLSKELADALTILVADLPAWNWPETGVPSRALWTRNKWRLYLTTDLPTGCLLEIMSARWQERLKAYFDDGSALIATRARLRKLLDLNAPEVIIANERRMLREIEQRIDPTLLNRGGFDDETELIDPQSVIANRAEQMRQLRDFRSGDYSSPYGSPDRALLLIHAEITLMRTAFPRRPLFVLKLDLQDYFASIPHELLMTILERIGIPAADREFIRRFMTVPFTDVGPMQRGVPLSFGLSRTLAEIVLRMLDRAIDPSVRMIRLVDDICLIATSADAIVQAWNQVNAFCAGCGLTINLAKSGSIAFGAERPPELPTERPRWGMLELDETANWRVHEPTFEAHCEQTRNRILKCGSVLEAAEIYNSNARYVVRTLSLALPLGEVHRVAVNDALRRFHRALFGPNQGIIAKLIEMIRTRFLADAAPMDIPDAWLYWPVTAGGLGLRNPLIESGQYAVAFRDIEPVTPPDEVHDDWESRSAEWGIYYQNLLGELEPVSPSETKVMQTLVNDFIQRGSSISAGMQSTLSPYWRWILSTYGPQILERFGSFRFLITELVPLSLIGKQRLDGGSTNEPGRSDATDDIPF